ncbi:hypothetical protein [Longispora urticae]
MTILFGDSPKRSEARAMGWWVLGTVVVALVAIGVGWHHRRRARAARVLARVRAILDAELRRSPSTFRAAGRDVLDAVVRIDRAASGVHRAVVRLTTRPHESVTDRALVAESMRLLLEVDEPRTVLYAHTGDRADAVTAAVVLAAARPPLGEPDPAGSLRPPPPLSEHPRLAGLATGMYRTARVRCRALHRLLIAARSLPRSKLSPSEIRALAEALRSATSQVSDAGLRVVNGRPLAAVRLLIEVDLPATDSPGLGTAHLRTLADLGSAHRVRVIDWALASVTDLYRRQLDGPRQP